LSRPNDFSPGQVLSASAGQSKEKQRGRFRSDHTGTAEPQGDHDEDCDADRLKDGPLLGRRPAPQIAPYDRRNPGKAGAPPMTPLTIPTAPSAIRPARLAAAKSHRNQA
jgi:hypothetical protein